MHGTQPSLGFATHVLLDGHTAEAENSFMQGFSLMASEGIIEMNPRTVSCDTYHYVQNLSFIRAFIPLKAIEINSMSPMYCEF